uniref:Uncharacterized protein n=1 Tax=Hanusia phi TaxID=3032 RepID=A0A7S0EHH5_9CRYP|mmetsp:Transcript_24644/g.55679  ORF Transcript_24644/g.55679 Transcript_24644/m.55679 type:complete len:249 (+) Transcript_24644:109-855(+)
MASTWTERDQWAQAFPSEIGDELGTTVKRVKSPDEENDEDSEQEENSAGSESSRNRYKCGRCGQPKKGHTCFKLKEAKDELWSGDPMVSFHNVRLDKRQQLKTKLIERLSRRLQSFGIPPASSYSFDTRFMSPYMNPYHAWSGPPPPSMPPFPGFNANMRFGGMPGMMLQSPVSFGQPPPGVPGISMPMSFPPVTSGPINPLVGISGMPYGDGGGYPDMSWQEPASVNGAGEKQKKRHKTSTAVKENK